MASAKTGRRLPRNRGLHGVVGLARGPVAELRAAEAEELAQLMRVGMRIRHAPVQMHAASAAGAARRLLAGIKLDMDDILDDAKGRKAKELVQEYVRREPDAVTQVLELLTDAGVSMDGLMADALAKKLDDIERIDRLTTIAESRRNASLHEIERRRAVLGETLRRSVQEIEDGEFEVIETTPAQGKNAA